MNIRPLIYLSFLCLFSWIMNQSVNAQEPDVQIIEKLESYFDKTYGLDQKLISGIQYYSKNPRALGNEFFGTGEFSDGRLIINGSEYDKVKIRYDIYDQRINLLFNYDSSAANTIIIEGYKVNEFEMNGMLFRKSYFPGKDTSFYQVIAEGRVSCFYCWYKNLTLQTSSRNVYEYSEPRRKSYLLIDSTLTRYTWKHTFLKLLNDNKADIRKYMRRNQINLRHAPDQAIAGLIRFCNSLAYQAAEK
jgi:hypothetical protein